MELSGKVAIITGGARGFGRAFGQALADRGTRVVLVDIDLAEAERAASEIGARAEAVFGDVADAEAMEALAADVTARHGGIDILINNAGIHSAEANEFIGKLGLDRTRRMFEVNVWGVINCTMATRPHMAGRSGAAIVNISSMASYGSQKAYGVTKLTVRGLTASFAHELGPEGIRVNGIAPGLIMTDTIRAELPEPIVKAVQATQILRRDGAESDIVETMLWLVSDHSGFITGETIRVSGGAALTV